MIMTVLTTAETGSWSLRDRRCELVTGPDPKIIHNVRTRSWSLVVLFLLLGEDVHDSKSQVHFEDEDIIYRQNQEPGCGGGI